jgi:hypothetical protein
MVRKPAGLDPERLVFIDETWATTNMARKKGRARKGARPKVRGCAPLPRAPKTSASLRRRYAARALCSWTQSASSRRFRLKKTGVRNVNGGEISCHWGGVKPGQLVAIADVQRGPIGPLCTSAAK